MSPTPPHDAPPGAPTATLAPGATPSAPAPGPGAPAAAAALPPDLVLALARLEGHAALDAETAARIAVGAANAIAAVTASAGEPLFDAEPGDYAVELERLADEAPR